jgi:hypothetical protein
MKEELFTTTELTSFGKYLLSAERANHILNSEIEGDPLDMLREVHHADFENWKAKHGEAGVSAEHLIGAAELLKIREDLESGLRANGNDIPMFIPLGGATTGGVLSFEPVPISFFQTTT